MLLVAADGRLAGSVSGGCVEGAAFEEVEHARATRRARVIRYGISDEQAWDVGLACGGTIDVLIEPAVRRRRSRTRPGDARAGRSSRRCPAGSPRAGVRASTRRAAGAPPTADSVVVDQDAGLTGTSGDAPAVDDSCRGRATEPSQRGRSRTLEAAAAQLFVEVFPAARDWSSSARSRRPSRWRASRRARLRDRRRRRASGVRDAGERFPDADGLIVGWPDEVAEQIGLGAGDAVRRAQPRSQGRRAGHRRGAAAGLPLRGRHRQPQDAGRAPRAAPRARASRDEELARAARAHRP